MNTADLVGYITGLQSIYQFESTQTNNHPHPLLIKEYERSVKALYELLSKEEAKENKDEA